MAVMIDQDNQDAEEGVWAKYRGSEFKIVHSGNAKFQRALSRLQAPHRRKIEKGSMDPVESKDLICTAMSEGLVIGWRGVIDSAKNEVPFSKSACAQALRNNSDLREFVQEFAVDLDNFRVEQIDSEGNV